MSLIQTWSPAAAQHTGCVQYRSQRKEGGRVGKERKEKPMAWRQTFAPKYIKVYGYICRFNVTFDHWITTGHIK